ncbi:MAG: alpha/beta fold hydrolase [Betaproteobacteria bacterium]|nr:alpha/beta fold hydrolase [Betaproteobacteria bacterium]
MLRAPGLTLRAYGEPRARAGAILMVPAPIKRAYIWDLAPGASVVEQCLKNGRIAYVAQWEEPPESFGLRDYGERLLLACADAIRAETGERAVFLFGHSLGGLFAAIFAALHPARVRGLVLAAAPPGARDRAAALRRGRIPARHSAA